MDEEAGFIAALLAEPDDRTVLLVYADWLDERDDPRAQLLRLLASDQAEQQSTWMLDQDTNAWLQLIASRKFRVKDRVKMREGPFAGMEGIVFAIAPDRSHADVAPIVGRPTTLELPFTSLEFIARSPDEQE